MNAKKLTQLPAMLTFVVAAPALWVISGLTVLVEKYLLHWPKEFWHIFFSDVRYSDFTIFQTQFDAFRTPQFWQPHLWRQQNFPFTYPASSALAFEAFFSLPRHHLQYFLLFILTSAIVGAIAAGRVLYRRGLGFVSALLFATVALVTSYPFMFLFDRANIEIVNWIFVSLAVAAFWCERWKLSGFLIGVAISLKLFPFILLGLFPPRRKFAAIFIAIATCISLDIGSLAILGPTVKVANHQISLGMSFFQDKYVNGFHPTEIPFDHSLFAVVKQIANRVGMADFAHLRRFVRWYMGVAVSGCLLLYFCRITRLPRVNQIVILLTLSVLLPPVSADYTLVNLYPGWLILALFTIDLRPGVLRSRVLPICFLIFAITFCPETYLIIGNSHVAGSLKAMALLMLVVLLLFYRLEERSQPAAMTGLT